MNTEYATMDDQPQQSEVFLNLREDLIRLSAAKEIKQTETYLKKASHSALEKIKLAYDRQQQDRVNTLLTETLITKFSVLIKEFDMIKDNEKLDAELTSNKLFCDDVKSCVKKISPYIPMIGLLTGALIVAKHVWDKPCKKTMDKDVTVQNDENPNTNGDNSHVVNSNDDRTNTS